MKKIAATVVCLFALTVAAVPVGAQTRSRRNYDQRIQTSRYRNESASRYRGDSRYRDRIYRNQAYDDRSYGTSNSGNYRYDNRSFWEKHQDKLTTAAGAAAGAVIGGIAGGKKGAIIGAITGGGGAAIYTYGIRDK